MKTYPTLFYDIKGPLGIFVCFVCKVLQNGQKKKDDRGLSFSTLRFSGASFLGHTLTAPVLIWPC